MDKTPLPGPACLQHPHSNPFSLAAFGKLFTASPKLCPSSLHDSPGSSEKSTTPRAARPGVTPLHAPCSPTAESSRLSTPSQSLPQPAPPQQPAPARQRAGAHTRGPRPPAPAGPGHPGLGRSDASRRPALGPGGEDPGDERLPALEPWARLPPLDSGEGGGTADTGAGDPCPSPRAEQPGRRRRAVDPKMCGGDSASSRPFSGPVTRIQTRSSRTSDRVKESTRSRSG